MEQTHNKSYLLIIYVGLALATFIAFSEVRRCGFVDLDDTDYVTKNPHVTKGLTLGSIAWAFTHAHSGNWHPLTSLSHMVDCQLFGLSASGHHMINLLFHIAATLLLFAVLKKMTGAIWPSAFVAAAFALHPLHVESVAWVSERKDVLSGFFFMLTIMLYLHYAQRPTVRRYLLVVLVFCLGLMSKPMLVTLPFVLLLLDYWPLGRFQLAVRDTQDKPQQPQENEITYPKLSAGRLILEKIPLLVLVVILSTIVFVIQRKAGAMQMMVKLPLNVRSANALISYVGYLAKTFYPTRLAVFYPYPKVLKINEALLLLPLISILAIRWTRQRPWFIVGWLWYIGTLVPVIGLVQVGNQAMADRYTYLPSIGVFIIVAWGAAELLHKVPYRKVILAASAVGALSILLVLTKLQVQHWQNDLTLFGHASRATEHNFIMHNKYGNALLKTGQTDPAIEEINKALEINPRFSKANHNMGLALLKKGKPDEALKAWEKAIETNRNFLEAHLAIGMLAASQGKQDQATKHFQEVLRINPNHAVARRELDKLYRTE
ncbi:MAG: tetratricopeptide repeat protein [Planctomycetota bacterium]|jgi:tetratricopeptide (TPR) repeat protein